MGRQWSLQDRGAGEQLREHQNQFEARLQESGFQPGGKRQHRAEGILLGGSLGCGCFQSTGRTEL